MNLSKSNVLTGSLPQIGDEDQDLAAWSQVRMTRSLSEQIQVLASTICLESGDLSRFTRVGRSASYARVVKADKITNRKSKGKGNRRSGNAYLEWAYHEAAHCMNRCPPMLQDYRKRGVSQGKHPRVVWSAMAHKICRGLYFVMRDGVEFSPARLFG